MLSSVQFQRFCVAMRSLRIDHGIVVSKQGAYATAKVADRDAARIVAGTLSTFGHAVVEPVTNGFLVSVALGFRP